MSNKADNILATHDKDYNLYCDKCGEPITTGEKYLNTYVSLENDGVEIDICTDCIIKAHSELRIH